MAGYVSLGDRASGDRASGADHVWVDDRGGPGAAVLLLHGGLSHGDVLMDCLEPRLRDHYRLVAFDRRGHGRTGDSAAPFHYAEMVAQTIRVLETVVGGSAHLVGWSDGGIVALLVAIERPDLVDRLVVIGANYHWEAFLAAESDPGFARTVKVDYAERSPDGPAHYGAVVRKSLTLWRTEPALTTDDVARITAVTLVVVGDDDDVPLAHTGSLFEALPRGRLAVVPAASHALPIEQPAALAQLVADFLPAVDPPRTLLPVRRADGATASGG